MWVISNKNLIKEKDNGNSNGQLNEKNNKRGQFPT